jgi:hypothetical protein
MLSKTVVTILRRAELCREARQQNKRVALLHFI